MIGGADLPMMDGGKHGDHWVNGGRGESEVMRAAEMRDRAVFRTGRVLCQNIRLILEQRPFSSFRKFP